jgi:hypothetical protein
MMVFAISMQMGINSMIVSESLTHVVFAMVQAQSLVVVVRISQMDIATAVAMCLMWLVRAAVLAKMTSMATEFAMMRASQGAPMRLHATMIQALRFMMILATLPPATAAQTR